MCCDWGKIESEFGLGFGTSLATRAPDKDVNRKGET